MSVELVVLPNPLTNPLKIGVFAHGSPWTFKLVISNPSQQPLLWHAKTDGATWLALGQSEGTLSPGESQTIDVSIDTSTLAAENYEATLTFTSVDEDGSTASVPVPVTLSVVSVPGINADGSPIGFPSTAGGVPSVGGHAQSFTSLSGPIINLSEGDSKVLPVAIPNPFNEEANWKATIQTSTNAADWLSLSPTGGTLDPGETETLLVTANAGNLTVGQNYTSILKIVFEASGNKSHTSTIGITVYVGCYSDNGPKCPVVTPPSPLNLSSTQLAEGFQLQVTNPQANNQVSWTADNKVSWLLLNPTAGKLVKGGQTQITLKTGASGLQPGTYSTDLTITFTDPTLLHPTTALPFTIAVTA